MNEYKERCRVAELEVLALKVDLENAVEKTNQLEKDKFNLRKKLAEAEENAMERMKEVGEVSGGRVGKLMLLM